MGANDSAVKPLVFNQDHQPERADVLNYTFYVDDSGCGWRWAVWDRSLTAFAWNECNSRAEAIAACNQEWQEILAPFISAEESTNCEVDSEESPNEL